LFDFRYNRASGSVATHAYLVAIRPSEVAPIATGVPMSSTATATGYRLNLRVDVSIS
jgi:hypothetical protein